MKEILENKDVKKDKDKPTFIQSNTFELLDTLNVINSSTDASFTDLENMKTGAIDNFKKDMKYKIEEDKKIQKRKEKIIPYGWDITKFNNENYYVFNLNFKDFKKKFDSIELDDSHLNETNLINKLEIENTKHTVVKDDEVIKYKNNFIISDNDNLEEIVFDKLKIIGRKMLISDNKQLKKINLSKLKQVEIIEIENNMNLTEINLSSLKSVNNLLINGDDIKNLDLRNLREVKGFGDFYGGIQINVNAKVIINKKLYDIYNKYYKKIESAPSINKQKFIIAKNWLQHVLIIDKDEKNK